MTSSSHRASAVSFGQKRRRRPWRSPFGAFALALLAAGLGVFGFQQVTAEPTRQIEFIVEDGLPYGITQESVEAAAEDRALSYQAFTMHVVGRELTWAETYRGEIGDADLLFSVGSDAEDPDTVLEDFNRVAFSGVSNSENGIGDAQDIRAAFVNNQTLGHGPSAVVGAALTAADVRFDGGNRSAAYWASFSALPMFVAILVMFFWSRDRRVERKNAQRLSAAQLRLARVVLELDSLEFRFDIAQEALQVQAGAELKSRPLLARLRGHQSTAADEHMTQLHTQWQDVRSMSLELARHETRLQRIFRENARLEAGETREQALKDLDDFDELSRALKRQADALADATELRAGHAGSRSVLDRIALPLIQALDDILRHREQLSEAVEALEQARAELLALSGQAASYEASEADGAVSDGESEEVRLVRDHIELLEQWDGAEQRIRDATAQIITTLRRQLKAEDKGVTTDRLLNKAAGERAEQRILAMTAGRIDSFHELRASLGLGHGAETGPLQAAERVLELLEMGQRDYAQLRAEQAQEENHAAGTLVAILLPIAVAFGAGAWALSQAEAPQAYGRELTGDQPLAGLNVFGDPEQLPDEEDPRFPDEPTQAESLDLDLIRDTMQRSMDSDPHAALLPAELILTVAVVPADEYFEYQRYDPEFAGRMSIGYWDLIDGQHRLKLDVAEEFPEILDPVTGDIRIGQGILPVWVLDENTYAVGYAMTGEISSGADSRMGRYSFQATEPTRYGPNEDLHMLVGNTIAYDLFDLGRAMEYNHMETANVEPGSVFWMTTISVWTGQLTLMILGSAVADSARRRMGTKESRKQLEALDVQLNDLTLGLDMSRLDLVAVLGGEGSDTGGDAEASEQRLYEAGLVTAWREVEDLKTLPRKQQKGEDWDSRVTNVQQLVEMLSIRSEDISTRAGELLRSQRAISEFR